MAMLVHQPWRDAERYHRLGLWRDTTLPGMLEHNAHAEPEGTAYVEGPDVLSWSGLRNAAGAMAEALAERGCAVGDVVVIVLQDGPELVASMAAVQSLGAVTAPLPSASGAAEVRSVVERTASRLVVATEAVPGLEDRTLVVPGRAREWARGPVELLPHGRVVDPDAVADLMFTSGTTGRPKGVMNSANTKLAGLRGFLDVHRFDDSDVWGVIPSMAHNAGWLYTALPAIATRAPLVAVGRRGAVSMLDALERHRVTTTFLVPAHVTDLVRACQEHPGRWQLSLRHVITGAAPAQGSVLRQAAELWGITPISMYGMTECQGNLFTRPDDPWQVWAETVGRPCPGAEVALRDVGTGRLVHGEGATGEVVTRGATTFLGYYDDQAATSAAFTRDGWFRSGDLGAWAGGSVKIVGRIKEVILRGGQTIVPDELELAFADIDGIGSVAVVGLPDERLGEKTCLVVTGRVPTREELAGHLRDKGLSRQLLPDHVCSLSSLPSTELGKTKRAVVRQLVLQAD